MAPRAFDAEPATFFAVTDEELWPASPSGIVNVDFVAPEIASQPVPDLPQSSHWNE